MTPRLENKLIEIARAMMPLRERRTHHVSFILKSNRIICIGTNKSRTHSTNLLNPAVNNRGIDYSCNKGICSELDAILKLKRLTAIRTEKLTLVNVRIDLQHQITDSRPCMSCQSLLRYHAFKNVYHTTSQNKFVKYA